MSEERPRPSILVIIPPPAWALLFILVGWGIGASLHLAPIFQHTLAGFVVFAMGFAVSASGRLAFAKAGTEVVPASKKNSALVISGPFKFTRNPMYLGILIAMIGLAMVIGSLSAYAAVIVYFLFVNFVSIPYEEEKMERQFGDAFRDYKSRVRRWI